MIHPGQKHLPATRLTYVTSLQGKRRFQPEDYTYYICFQSIKPALDNLLPIPFCITNANFFYEKC